MSDDATAHLGLPYIAAAQAQKHVTHNEALHILDCLVQLAVLDQDLATPPGSPTEGDRYIVAASATGAWAGHDGEIAAYVDAAWSFHTPGAGWIAFVMDEATLYFWTGSAWASMQGIITALQNLTLLGIGTTADATNPFSAKLNKALWTAKTAAEGGDGDLRYTLNKETAGDTVSLLFQDGYSGRAELGLIGDDHLTVKVSPDGSAWTNALVIDESSGNVLIGDYSNLSIYAASQLTVRRDAGIVGLGVTANNAAFFAFNAYSSSQQPQIYFSRGRGTDASPAAVQSGDGLGRITFRGYGSSSVLVIAGSMRATAIAATPSATDMQARWQLYLCASGSVTETELLRAEHATGLSMFGANPVIDANRGHVLRDYTIATLPAASAAPNTAFWCSDLGGGAGQVNSDGTSWRRVGRGGQQTVSSNAALTLTVLTNAEEQKHTGTLTANRAVTLSTTNAYAGARFRITRTGGGAFTLDVGTGPLKSLATNTWGEFVYDGAAWYLAAYGPL